MNVFYILMRMNINNLCVVSKFSASDWSVSGHALIKYPEVCGQILSNILKYPEVSGQILPIILKYPEICGQILPNFLKYPEVGGQILRISRNILKLVNRSFQIS